MKDKPGVKFMMTTVIGGLVFFVPLMLLSGARSLQV